MTDSMVEIIKQARWEKLTSLALLFGSVTVQGVKVLGESQLLNLEVLDLSGNVIGNEGVKWIRKMLVPRLRVLKLVRTGLTQDCVKVLLKGGNLE